MKIRIRINTTNQQMINKFCMAIQIVRLTLYEVTFLFFHQKKQVKIVSYSSDATIDLLA